MSEKPYSQFLLGEGSNDAEVLDFCVKLMAERFRQENTVAAIDALVSNCKEFAICKKCANVLRETELETDTREFLLLIGDIWPLFNFGVPERLLEVDSIEQAVALTEETYHQTNLFLTHAAEQLASKMSDISDEDVYSTASEILVASKICELVKAQLPSIVANEDRTREPPQFADFCGLHPSSFYDHEFISDVANEGAYIHMHFINYERMIAEDDEIAESGDLESIYYQSEEDDVDLPL